MFDFQQMISEVSVLGHIPHFLKMHFIAASRLVQKINIVIPQQKSCCLLQFLLLTLLPVPTDLPQWSVGL